MNATSAMPKGRKVKVGLTWGEDWRRHRVLYLLFVPTALYFIIFHYIPMFGIAIAFEDFSIRKGVFGSAWIGFENFIGLFTGDSFAQVMRNTTAMALLNLTVAFIAPIIFAVLLCELRSKPFRRTVQVMSYMPHFVAVVVVCQLLKEFLGNNGAITQLLTAMGLGRQNWLANANVPVFWLINCFASVWQEVGFGSIIYVATISSINADLQEAAVVDGANRFDRIMKITLPCIKPMIVMMFIINCGLFFTSGFDKILLLYMPSTYETADVLSSYTYRMAFGGQADYGLSTASGLFQSVLSLALLLGSNALGKRLTNASLF